MSSVNDFNISNGILRKYTGPGGDIVIPDGVREISSRAFQWSAVNSVVIPEGVTAIGSNAFTWCGSLESVTFPQSLTHIYGEAFSGCKKLTEAILPNGLQVLGPNAFQFCSSLERLQLGKNLTEIPMKAFFGCSSLRSVTIPDGVKSIGVSAFDDCSNLESVIIPGSVTHIDRSAFSGCKKLTGVTIPSGVTSIGAAAFWGCDGMADENSMVIFDNVLQYCASEESVVTVPEGVTTIGVHAFTQKANLKTVILPQSVTTIGASSFYGCQCLTDIRFPENLKAIEGHAFESCKKLASVAIPAGVTEIGIHAFADCTTLKSVTLPTWLNAIEECVFAKTGLTEIIIPDGYTTIKGGAFRNCEKLKRVVLPESLKTIEVGDYHTGGAFTGCEALSEFLGGSPDLKIPNGTFGHWGLPKGLAKHAEELVFKLADPAVLDYVVKGKAFDLMSTQMQVSLMLTKQGKTLLKEYNQKRIDWGKIAEEITARIHDQYTAKECNAVATLMVGLCDRFNDARVQAMYAKLEPLKTATKAKKTIQDCSSLMKKLKLEAKVDDSLKGIAKAVAEQMLATGKTQKEAEAELKNFYGITAKDLPALKDTKGKKVDPVVFVWLMTTHETLEKTYYGNPDVIAGYDKPGIRPEVLPVLAELDQTVFMKALQTIAKKNLGMTGRSKKMFLAYPICRYADETLMVELTKTAPSWRSSVSGNEAPPLLNFRRANMYSNTRAAMMFADKYKELDHYARIRGTDADTLRDQNLSDVGIDANGCKTYDLGNQVVTARLQDDLSFIIELPTVKTAKSLPKKGADEALHAAANADFSEMKKNVKKILKNRNTILFQEFLSGKERAADGWKSAYLDNALLRRAAKLLVWVQGKNTFTVSDAGTIFADGTAYELTSKKIALAHPMDMSAADLKAWQKYFTTRGLKQPFEQVWEPVVDPATVTEDRYKDCMIPFYRFSAQAKHGIHVYDEDFHNDITIIFEDCDAVVDRIDWVRHEISPDHNFEVTSFTYKQYTRKVNHIVAYLDKVTVFGRIAKDDVSIANRLDSFTLAQITECIRIAQENNATNVTALLLEHKNNHFADFDPMEEFTLDL